MKLRRVLGRVLVDGPYHGLEFVFIQEFAVLPDKKIDPTLRWVTEHEVEGALLHGTGAEVRVIREYPSVDVDEHKLQALSIGKRDT